jgi:uncharacterized protein
MGVIRVLSEDKIEHLLSTALVGRIACCAHEPEDNRRPYLVPLAYGYDGTAIYAHSGTGRKIRIMRANPLVTIEVDEATEADRWSSVIAEGRYEELTDPAVIAAAIRHIYPEPAEIPDLPPDTIVYRIVLTAKSGRYELPE